MTIDIDALRKQRAAKHDEIKGLAEKAEAENRDLTETEQKGWDEGLAAVKALDARIERAVIAEHNEAERARPAAAHAARPGMPKFFAAHRLKSFRRGTDAERVEAAYRSGMFLAASLFKMPWAKAWCEEHGIPLVYTKWADAAEEKAMTEGSNTAGGFLVPTEFENSIIDLRETYGVFRQWSRVVPMSRDTLQQPRRTGGLTAYAIGERTTITASDKSWDAVQLTARKWGVLCRYSSELAADAVINLADDLAGEIAYAFATTEDDCGFNGDGTSTYHGIRGVLTKIIDAAYTAGAVDATSGHDTFAEVDATDLSNMMAKLPQYALANAKFYCSQPAFSLVFERLAQAAGGISKAETGSPTPYRYQGYPIVISQKLPTSTSTINNTPLLLFGDLAMGSMFGDRSGVMVASSEHVYFTSDELAIRGIERFDINVHSLGDTSTAGPIVALIGNT